MRDDVTEKLMEMTGKYVEGIDTFVRNVGNTTLKDFSGSIAESEKLGRLTEIVLEIVAKIEYVIDEYESAMTRLDFFIRQEYNIGRYMLDTSVSKHHWKYSGKVNLVQGG